MAGNYDKFTPVIQLDEITNAEENFLAAAVALADSGASEFLQIVGGVLVNTQLTFDVTGGGTGLTSLEPYALLAGGITATGAMQQIDNSAAVVGQVLTYVGSNSLPTWQTKGGAPTGAKYIVVQTHVDLSDERVLTGTADQVIISDGGAGGNITLSLPQSIATSSNVQFANITGNSILAASNDVGALGASGTAWSDLYLASGGIIDWNAGDVVLTHTANTLTMTGGLLSLAAGLTVVGTTTLDTGLTGVLRADSGVVSVDSDVTDLTKKEVAFSIFESDVSVSVGDGRSAYTIPAILNGMNLTAAVASVHTKGITGTTDVQIRRRRAGSNADMLATKITIGDEFFAADGAIEGTADDVNTGDQIYIDVDAIHSGTAPLGLSITLTFN